MRLKDLLWEIWIYLTSDRKKLKFMNELMETTVGNEKMMDFLQRKVDRSIQAGKSSTEYLDELYNFWETGKDIRTKINMDMEFDAGN